ncbi:MAG: hypothetical protein IT260_21770 [Saprospiraceae bacterium]|nr:hypothetical protein [Saprospiraceae bacterium]
MVFPIRIAGLLLVAQVLAVPYVVRGQQCTYKVSHLSGTQQVGCTNVSVSSAGSAGSIVPLCGKDPYLIGSTSPGSYTFTFSPPVSGVRVSLYAINNFAPPFDSQEEVAFTVNGTFYPITSPGVADGCLPEAVISPTGTIRGCVECASAWDDLEITTTISSLKVEDIYLSGAPFGVVFSLNLCCVGPVCLTDAGQINAAPLTICGTGTASVPAATPTVLEPDDLLQYILFSDPNDTLGSILATSATPVFAFNPATMQTGLTYYIAAIAGNGIGSNVDLTDECLDISNGIPVSWQPIPAVSFSVANADVCAGACATVTAIFSGTPPFTLSYSATGAGSSTLVFSASTGSFQVCPALGGPLGSLAINATQVQDAWCICSP